MSEQRQRSFRAPPGATGLLLVRHGESAASLPDQPFELLDGYGDPPLHPNGRIQAGQVAERLAAEPITALYVTPLRRTAETAAPLARRLGLTPAVEAGLREVHLGEWEGGALRHHSAAGHPLALQVWAEERWDLIPGAEPAAAFDRRVREALEGIVGRHPDELVAVFAHGGVIASVLAMATGSRAFAFLTADNASVSHLIRTGERWVLRCFNDTAHLGGTFAAGVPG